MVAVALLQDWSYRIDELHTVLYFILRPDGTTYKRCSKRYSLDGTLRTGKDLSVWRPDNTRRGRIQAIQEHA